ncbi:hypothetical protein Tco_0027297 [Tanacetum coccineum]
MKRMYGPQNVVVQDSPRGALSKRNIAHGTGLCDRQILGAMTWLHSSSKLRHSHRYPFSSFFLSSNECLCVLRTPTTYMTPSSVANSSNRKSKKMHDAMTDPSDGNSESAEDTSGQVTALRSHRPRGSLHSKGTGQTCHSKAANLLTFVIVEAHSLTLNIKHNYKVTALRSHRPRGLLHSKGTGQTCHSKAANLLTFVIVEAHSFTLNIKHNYKIRKPTSFSNRHWQHPILSLSTRIGEEYLALRGPERETVAGKNHNNRGVMLKEIKPAEAYEMSGVKAGLTTGLNISSTLYLQVACYHLQQDETCNGTVVPSGIVVSVDAFDVGGHLVSGSGLRLIVCEPALEWATCFFLVDEVEVAGRCYCGGG